MTFGHYKVTIFNENSCGFEFKVEGYGKNDAIKSALEKYKLEESGGIATIKVEEDTPYVVVVRDSEKGRSLWSKDYYCDSKTQASRLGIDDFMQVAYEFEYNSILINVD